MFSSLGPSRRNEPTPVHVRVINHFPFLAIYFHAIPFGWFSSFGQSRRNEPTRVHVGVINPFPFLETYFHAIPFGWFSLLGPSRRNEPAPVHVGVLHQVFLVSFMQCLFSVLLSNIYADGRLII